MATPAGTSAHGGVLVVAGDDHTCKSSSLPHQSEYSFVDAMIPVLNPADVSEIVELGLYGFALSRFSGCWIGLKVTQETADATQSFELLPQDLRIVLPPFDMPPGGLNIRWPDPPNDQEFRLQRHKLRAGARVRSREPAEPHDHRGPQPAVRDRHDRQSASRHAASAGRPRHRSEARGDIGIKLFKVGMSWPLEPDAIRQFAEGLEEIVVVEEKRGVVENQLKEQLYNWQARVRPLIIGKRDEHGEWLLPSNGELTPALIARVLAKRMRRFYSSSDIEERVRFLEQQEAIYRSSRPTCSASRTLLGLPAQHVDASTEGSRAVGGIGCHTWRPGWTAARSPTRRWAARARPDWPGAVHGHAHVFQNIGDGTYAHSGRSRSAPRSQPA
jgi:indolepyruvate ferredoxin oxidoreductase